MFQQEAMDQLFVWFLEILEKVILTALKSSRKKNLEFPTSTQEFNLMFQLFTSLAERSKHCKLSLCSKAYKQCLKNVTYTAANGEVTSVVCFYLKFETSV